MSQRTPDFEDPEESRSISVPVSPEFLEDAERRGVDPKVFLSRLTALFLQMAWEGESLFEDWEEWPTQKQLRWCRDGTVARANLEFPYLDG